MFAYGPRTFLLKQDLYKDFKSTLIDLILFWRRLDMIFVSKM